jgi:methionyl-tRNA formyltransferase
VSLLPKYRGSAPVQWSVLNGDTETGVTIMQLDEGVDTGDILQVAPVTIGENETSGELFDRISELGAKTLCDTMVLIEKGEVTPVPQDHAAATHAPMLTKEMGYFDFGKDARALHNHIRGMNPWPVASFVCAEKRVKVLRSTVREETGAPGTVLCLKPLVVACENGSLCLEEVVPEGSRPMSGEVWAMGRRFAVGDRIE